MPVWDATAPVVDVPCPFCREGVRRRIVETVWDAQQSAVFQCDGCEIVFIHPIMTPEEESAFYAAEFSTYMKLRGAAGETVPQAHFDGNSAEARRRVANLAPYLRPDMKALEIGCSTGFMLAELQPYVSSAFGVEPNRLYSKYAQSRGFRVVHDLREISGLSFDLILAYYVLEHLRDPQTYLRRLHDMLTPEGMLVIEVPNVDDALVRFYQLESFDRFYWQKAHYYYYSYRTLAKVMKTAGFGSVETIPEQRYDFSNHIHWLMKGEPGGTGKYADVFGNPLDQAYSECLKAKWLCDTIFAVAYPGKRRPTKNKLPPYNAV